MNISKITSLLNKKDQLVKNEVKGSKQDQALSFFKNVYGLENLKENIYRAMKSPNPTNSLIIGPPATCKSQILQIINDQCNNTLYIDASSGTTGAGLISILNANRNAKILLIDEIDKMKVTDQNVLLGLLSTGRVTKVLKNETIDFSMAVHVFATSNTTNFKSKALASRFIKYVIQPYSDEEFIEVSKHCLSDSKLPVDTVEVIAKTLIVQGKKNIRLVMNLANSIFKDDSEDDVIRVITNFLELNEGADNVDYNS
jgi:Holliday junction DNA helicase RuvB